MRAYEWEEDALCFVHCSYFFAVKILVIRFSSIGDIVLTSPVLRMLSEQVPNAEIHYLTRERFANLVRPNPHVHRVWTLEQEARLGDLMALLRNENFDFIADLHHNLRSLRVKWALRRPGASFRKLNPEKFLYVHFRRPALPPIHIVQRYLETVAALGVKDDGKGLEFYPHPQRPTLPETHQKGYVALVCGALQGTKQIPRARLLELIQRMRLPVVLLGGPAERELGIGLAEQAAELPVWNACGTLSLEASASCLYFSTLVITPDTGLMHIAAAFEKPVISVWGNTIPEFGMGPYLKTQPLSMVAQVEGLSCRPCSKIGHAQCPKGHFRCMEDQNIGSIAETALRWFAFLTTREES
jgi:heptosyltransferase-2